MSVYRAATVNNLDNAIYLLNSGKILVLIESFVRHMNVSNKIQLNVLIIFFIGFEKRCFIDE